MRFAKLLAPFLVGAVGIVAHATILTRLDSTQNGVTNASVLSGSLFLDAASLGGGDTLSTVNYAQSTSRTFDLNHAAGAPGQQGVVTIEGFAFASGGGIPNSSSTLTFTFTYLGADGAVGGGNDVVIGSSEAVVFNDGANNGSGYEGAGRYYANFTSPPSAMIDGLNEKFLITIAPVYPGTMRFKTTTASGTSDSIDLAKFSVSGTFVAAVPEASSFVAYSLVSAVVALRRSRRRDA